MQDENPDCCPVGKSRDGLNTVCREYYSIPITLVYFVRKRKDLEFDWMFVCFAIFIVACGTTHIMEIWNIWHPTYWLSGGVKAVTALASVPTPEGLIKGSQWSIMPLQRGPQLRFNGDNAASIWYVAKKMSLTRV